MKLIKLFENLGLTIRVICLVVYCYWNYIFIGL